MARTYRRRLSLLLLIRFPIMDWTLRAADGNPCCKIGWHSDSYSGGVGRIGNLA
jgi:hypothetical protein